MATSGAPASYPAATERYGGASGIPPPPPGGDEAYEGRTIVGGLHIPGAATMYNVLALLQLAAGIVAVIAPYKMTEIFFRARHLEPGHVAPHDALYEELWRILGATLFASAITSYAVKIGAERRQLADWGIQRLQLGLVWFAIIAIVLHLIHLIFLKTLTLWGLLIGALIMAPTLLVPGVHLGLSGGFAVDGHSLSTCLRNVFAPRRYTVAVFLYALLTILFTVAGLGYLFLPRLTIKWVFGGVTVGKPAAFVWQFIGAGLLFLFPAITYTLQERAISGRLAQTVPKVLNVALLVAALFHILELGSLLVDDGASKARWLLPALFGHWVLVLLAAIAGLSAQGGADPAAEYEPLVGQHTEV